MKFFIALVPLHSPDLLLHLNLSPAVVVVIQPRSSVVQVVKLPFNFMHSPAGKLHKRDKQGQIVGDRKEHSFIILQVLRIDLA